MAASVVGRGPSQTMETADVEKCRGREAGLLRLPPGRARAVRARSSCARFTQYKGVVLEIGNEE